MFVKFDTEEALNQRTQTKFTDPKQSCGNDCVEDSARLEIQTAPEHAQIVIGGVQNDLPRFQCAAERLQIEIAQRIDNEIILTARGRESERVEGLRGGADDYVVKPFSPRELVARVHAVLRRTSRPDTSKKPRLSIGDLLLDLEKHQLSLRGHPVAVTPHEFILLQTLMAAPGKVPPAGVDFDFDRIRVDAVNCR